MLVEKEVLGPGTYWYTDQDTGLPRKLDVTPELTKYWHDQGSAMLSAGLTVPVPCEHDFNAHPMTPADKLKSNAGWVKEYRLHDGKGGKGDKLHAVVDILDPDIAKKLPHTIRWTSPWINSFTDGSGKQWNNVISHLALTTRPRITNQAPFPSIAAALSMASDVSLNVIWTGEDKVKPIGCTCPNYPQEKIRNGSGHQPTCPHHLSWLAQGGFNRENSKGFSLSRATRLVRVKSTKEIVPLYPMAFSLISGAAFGEFPPKKGKPKPEGGGKKPSPFGGGDKSGKGDPTTTADNNDVENPDGSDAGVPGAEGDEGSNVDLPPLGDKAGDVSMEEVLCDLLRALGVNVEHTGDESQFKRSLYSATMQKVHELTNKGMNKEEQPKPGAISKDKPPGSPGAQPNPLIQQEQPPMYMSLEDINKLDEPLKSVALSMYNETVKANAKASEAEKVLNSLRDAKLKEENDKRLKRVALLSKLSPRVKSDLEAMLALPAMALSMGDGGSVVDPMATTLAVLEKGLSDMPKLLTTDASALFAQPQPTDQDMLSAEAESSLVDSMARMMGAPPEKKAS